MRPAYYRKNTPRLFLCQQFFCISAVAMATVDPDNGLELLCHAPMQKSYFHKRLALHLVTQALIKRHGVFARMQAYRRHTMLPRPTLGIVHQTAAYALALQRSVYRDLAHLQLA